MATMDIDDSLPFDDMAKPQDESRDVSFTRKTADYVANNQRFFVPTTSDFNQQYASVYFNRLEKLRPGLIERAKSLGWCDDGTEICDQLLRASETPSVVVATLFKEMKLKPKLLKEYVQGCGVQESEVLSNYCDDSDKIVIEDTSGRLELVPTPLLPIDSLVTGLVCMLLGVHKDGKFYCEKVEWPGVPSNINTLPIPVEGAGDSYVALVSGLQIGDKEAASSLLAMQMMVDFVSGHLGSSQEMAHAASITRVIMAGNSLSESTKGKEDGANLAGAAKELDTLLLQLCSSVPVDIMPGATDPAQTMLPQQPLHRCLLRESSRLKSLLGVTNPYDATVDGVNFVGTSGQNMDDLWRYTKSEASRMDLLAKTLEWRHCAPTIPETLACYPFKTEDPFVLDVCPHVYFAGNQPEFCDRLVEDEAQGTRTRVILVPSFATTNTIVLLNTRTLECEPVTFSV